ncbi:hypothetical protein [Roseibium sp.]|uniref:hypothetical protein n=1 Tax=Roseibium sp. TaxID=1936156 RepID=UPI003B50B52A
MSVYDDAVACDPASGPSLSVALTGFSLALLLVSLAAGIVDPRLLDGVPVWNKPTKFALSFVVLFGTIAWLEVRLSLPWRTGWLLRGTMAVMAVCMIAEMGYIMMQAGLGQASHFNLSTPFNHFMYTVVMAFGAVLLVTGIGVFGYAAWADRQADLTPALRIGTTLGFGVSFLLTLFIAGYTGGQESSLVGTVGTNHSTLPFLGWSTEVGDLRPVHFLALHAMQVLPLFGFLLDRWAISHRPVWVVSGTVIYTAATLLLFVQALAGQPLISL